MAPDRVVPAKRVPAQLVQAWRALGLAVLTLGGCAATMGVRPYAPGSFIVSEMRAPVLGGAAEAQRVALGEAGAFCAAEGRVFAPLSMAPGGYPGSVYGPIDFTAIFQCAAPPAGPR